VPRREAGSAGLGVVEGPHVGERGEASAAPGVGRVGRRDRECAVGIGTAPRPRVMDELYGWVVGSSRVAMKADLASVESAFLVLENISSQNITMMMWDRYSSHSS